MDVEGADFLSLCDDSPSEVDERLGDVQTILCCLQGLTDHIASLENEHMRVYKKNQKPLDLGLIRYQMWLSAAARKIMAVGRELEWNHNEWYCPEDVTPLPTGTKAILDESLNDGLAVPLEPERLWLVNSRDPRLTPRILAPNQHDNNVRFDIPEKIEPAESKNQIDNNEFQKKVDRLRFKLAVKEEESCTCLAYNRASNVLNNINSLEDNMNKMKLLLTLLEENIDVSPKKYVKEEESCTCPTFYDSRGSSILNNFRIEYNMTDLNQSLRPLENNIDMSPTKFGHIKNQFDGYATHSEASMKTFEGSLAQQKIIDRRLQPVVQSDNLVEDDGGVLKSEVPTPSLNLIQKEILMIRPIGSVDYRPRRRKSRESLPKNMKSIMIQYQNNEL